MQLNNRRRGTASAKTRGEVSRGRKETVETEGYGPGKVWKLHISGVGRAVDVAFGPKPKEYHMSVPKKVQKAALRSALTVRNEGSALKMLDKLDLEGISTKTFCGIMKVLNLTKPLVVVDGKDEMLEKSARNIPYTKVLRVEGLNVYDVMRHEQFVVTVDALQRIEEALSL